MTVAFRTSVYWSPPSPAGLIGGRFVVEHTCRACLAVVATDALIQHARAHGEVGVDHQPAASA